ncbi:MAG: efflux RND transporter periplasmic adaptor subunit [Gammaproteobacteria bacterium]
MVSQIPNFANPVSRAWSRPRRIVPKQYVVLPGLLALLLVACGGAKTAVEPSPSLVVTTTVPAAHEVERKLVISGSVAAWQEITLGVELTGVRVAEVLVEVGDRVKAGQTLVRLDARSLRVQSRQAEASVAQAKAGLELAQADFRRGQSLVKQGLISSSNADQLQANLSSAQAQLATADANLDAARLQLSFATLKAPEAGVISARSVQPGQIVSAGADMLKLIRDGRLEWRAELTESDLARVRTGMPVELTSPGGAKVTGTVRTVSPAVNPDTRTGMLYADLPDPGDLRAGMFAEGQLLLGKATATVLPRESVVYRDGFPYVFVAKGKAGQPDEAFNVEQRRIVVGQQYGDFTEVVSGVKAAEHVVVRGAGFLSNGDLVREVGADA